MGRAVQRIMGNEFGFQMKSFGFNEFFRSDLIRIKIRKIKNKKFMIIKNLKNTLGKKNLKYFFNFFGKI